LLCARQQSVGLSGDAHTQRRSCARQPCDVLSRAVFIKHTNMPCRVTSYLVAAAVPPPPLPPPPAHTTSTTTSTRHHHHHHHTSPPPPAAHTTSKSSSLILPSSSLAFTAAQTDPETLWKVVGDLGEGSFGMVHKVSIDDIREQPTAW
jgi:hypothetical protein